MPTFHQRTFSMDEKVPMPEWPPGTSPVVIKALKLFYENIVHRAEDMATVLLMETEAEDGPVSEMSEGEIEAFHFGAVVATTAFSEILQTRQMLDGPKWGAYINELLKRSQ